MTPIYSLIGFDTKIKDLGCELEKHVELAIFCKKNKKDISKTKNPEDYEIITEYNMVLTVIFDMIDNALKLYKGTVCDFDIIKYVAVYDCIQVLKEKLPLELKENLDYLNSIVNVLQSGIGKSDTRLKVEEKINEVKGIIGF